MYLKLVVALVSTPAYGNKRFLMELNISSISTTNLPAADPIDLTCLPAALQTILQAAGPIE